MNIIVREFGLLRAALQFLTRLPVAPAADGPPPPLAQAVPYFPLVGVIVGGSGAVVLLLCAALGLPMLAAAALTVAAQVMLTGALHEDGLADTADGLGGGATRERALEIMRDSRIGTYGALALGLILILRISLIGTLDPAAAALALIVAAALSRALMVSLMYALPPARAEGLSAGAGRPSAARCTAAVVLATAITLAFDAILALPIALMAYGWLRYRFEKRLGGATGDSYGATQQVTEVATLLPLAALWA